LAGCIDRGLDAVKPEQEVLRKQVEEIQEIAGTLDPKEGNSAQRQAQFQELIERFVAQGDSFQRPRTRLESWGTHDHYDDARLWSTVSCECEDG